MKTFGTVIRITSGAFAVALLFALPGGTYAQSNTFPSSGNAGVGTTSPQTALSVNVPFSSNGQEGSLVTGQTSNVTISGVYNVAEDVSAGKAGLAFKTYNAGSYLTRMSILAGGNVGIGTTSPGFALDVKATDGVGVLRIGSTHSGIGAIIDFDANAWGAGGRNYRLISSGSGNGAIGGSKFAIEDGGNYRFVLDSAGRVGIGTTSPNARLELQSADQEYMFGFKDTQSGVQWSFLNGASYTYGGGYQGRFILGSGMPGSTFAHRLTINPDSGNVGIGTLSPNYKLDVNGSINATGLNINGSPVASSQWSTSGGGINFTSGNVGIGTTSPAQRLEVAGNGMRLANPFEGTNFLFFGPNNDNNWFVGQRYDSSSQDPPGYYFDFGAYLGGGAYSSNARGFRFIDTRNGNTNFFIGTGGNVGVGKTNPGAKLDVNGTFAVSGWSYLGSGISTTSAGATLNIGGNGETGAIAFNTTGGNNKVYITTDGKVGIGTTGDPTAKLDVNGSINVSGNINAKYQDVAEWVPASEQLTAGTVVVLDSNKSNQVTSSSVSYDTRVAGVISEQPGIALGEKSDSKVLVATTGRVRVKVDASKGPIHIGDLLVTSDVPGVAMKSEPVEFAGRKMHMPGTLIGKALEPLEKGSGTILVLLSLQ
jgi:hypothetical protein